LVFLHQRMEDVRGGDSLPVNKLFGRKGLLTRQHFQWHDSIFIGRPQSGKCSLMQCLLGKHLSSCASTGVAKSVVHVEIRKSMVHVSGLLWCELEDLDDEATLIMCDAFKISLTPVETQMSPSLHRSSFKIPLLVPDVVNSIKTSFFAQAAVSCTATSTRGTGYQTST